VALAGESGLGGEPFLDLAPGGPATLLGYANGYAGYLPTRAAFDAAAERPEQPEYEGCSPASPPANPSAPSPSSGRPPEWLF